MSESLVTGLGEARTLVSLRVPRRLAEAVERYARDNGLRKTDAYLHFLMDGLQGEQATKTDERLSGIQAQLERVLDLLQMPGEGVAEKESEARSLEFESVCRAISDSARDYPAIRRAYLFGSFARKQFGPQSDIDVRIEVDRSNGFNLHDLTHFMKRIEQQTGREVDVVSADVIKNANLAAAIEREKVLVYEREEY